MVKRTPVNPTIDAEIPGNTIWSNRSSVSKTCRNTIELNIKSRPNPARSHQVVTTSETKSPSVATSDSAFLTIVTDSEGQLSTVLPTRTVPSNGNSSIVIESSSTPSGKSTMATSTSSGDSATSAITSTETASASSGSTTQTTVIIETSSTLSVNATTSAITSVSFPQSIARGTEILTTSSSNNTFGTQSSTESLTSPPNTTTQFSTTPGISPASSSSVDTTQTISSATNTLNLTSSATTQTNTGNETTPIATPPTISSDTSSISQNISTSVAVITNSATGSTRSEETSSMSETVNSAPTISSTEQATSKSQTTSESQNSPTDPVITRSDDQLMTQTPPAQQNPTTTTSSTGAIAPIITPVPDPKPADGGFVIPCRVWFFKSCIDIIQGWKVDLPPGSYHMGPPPPISIDPSVPIKVEITGTLPNWPEFTVRKCRIGPDHVPSFSSEPTKCETKTAEICVTSTSYGVSISASATSTIRTQVLSTCGQIYGCGVEDTATSTAITKTESSSTPTAKMPSIRWEKWESTQESPKEDEEAAEFAKSKMADAFGGSTAPANASFTTSNTPFSTSTGSSSSETESKTTESKIGSSTPTTESKVESSSSATTLTTEPVTPATSTVPTVGTTTASETPKKSTSLELQTIICNKESDFPGHAEIRDRSVRLTATAFCNRLTKGKDTLFRPSMRSPPDDIDLDMFRIKFKYAVSWVDDQCAVAGGSQSVRFPTGARKPNCARIFWDIWHGCESQNISRTRVRTAAH
ncbi:hypothetical protein CDD83_11010 [Cordyceps sp. RAO-2017]|nr:hypothetical protein CDD83_11010 [Cordyceps sp. RAO-2017]